MISLPVWESRLPVGSSARMIDGTIDQGAGDGDALALAAGELVGLVHHARFHADGRQRALARSTRSSAGDAGVNQRQFDVVQRGGAGQQVESLEDEADFFVADARQFVVVQFADQLAVQPVVALAGRVEAADQVHQRGLARTRTGP